LGAAALSGASAAPALAQAPAGPSLTVATGGSITSLDPHFFNASPNSSLALHIFNTLTDRTANAQLVPGLATSWRAVEPTIWEFKLREGVQWHDGRPFTAEDVAFTMTRAPNVPNSSGGFGGFIRSIARQAIAERVMEGPGRRHRAMAPAGRLQPYTRCACSAARHRRRAPPAGRGRLPPGLPPHAHQPE